MVNYLVRGIHLRSSREAAKLNAERRRRQRTVTTLLKGSCADVITSNLARMRAALGNLRIDAETDRRLGRLFEELLRRHGVRDQWWYEYRKRVEV